MGRTKLLDVWASGRLAGLSDCVDAVKERETGDYVTPLVQKQGG